VYLGVMGISFVLMVPLIILGERRDAVKRIFLSLLLIAALALLSLAFISMWADIQTTTNAVLILVGILCFFIGFNYLEATLPSLMSKTVADAHRGAGSSVFSTCQFLGAAVGGILGGWLFNRFGIAGLMFCCAAALFAWWLIACNMTMPKPAQNKVDVDNVLV
jgi:predicted MFS family arabinose efflux permease